MKKIRLEDKYVSTRKAISGDVLKVGSGWVQSGEATAPGIKMGSPPTSKKRKTDHRTN